jgi:Na+-translocating ferredoxin:NAD+ oxidoreductase RnfD subunit
LPAVTENQVAITEDMKKVRDMVTDDRKQLYLKERIEDQQKWYSKKSQDLQNKVKQWFWLSVTLHVIAIFLLLLRIKAYKYQFPIEVISTVASAILTWLQAKKFNELSAAYSHTAHEIAFIVSEADSVSSETELSNYVVNSETAFSREHTQWCARRVIY